MKLTSNIALLALAVLLALLPAGEAAAQQRRMAYPQQPMVQRQAYAYGTQMRVAAPMYRQVAYAYPQRQVAIRPAPVPAPVAVQPAMASNYLGFNGRFASAPAHMPAQVQMAVAAGNHLQNKPYVRGGGHSRVDDNAYDCSGSVSFALIKSGLLARPLSSKEFAGYGLPGPGKFITIYVKPGSHVFMSICGLRLDTTGGGEGQGPRWRPTARDSSGFIMRHPFGF